MAATYACVRHGCSRALRSGPAQCKKTTPLDKLMKAYCQRQGQTPNMVRFLFDGTRLHGNQTPSEVRVLRSCQCSLTLPFPVWARVSTLNDAADQLCVPCHQLDMEDGDVIDVMVEQQGGF
jgi:small ubiquitin-related modifier